MTLYNFFRVGWRPAAGWMCVVGMLYQFILRPILPWLLSALGADVQQLPATDIDSLMLMLGSMLGMGGLRTFEKIKGVV